jgi:hypothetical protein
VALHDYECGQCGDRAVDVFRTAAQGAQSDPPICVSCRLPMDWVPKIGRMDAFEPGQEFVCYDGKNQRVLVESLSQMRKIEKESEQHARNGEGQPMVWRKYSQDRGNTYTSTLGSSPAEAPSRAAQEKFGPTLRKSAEAPDVTFGPGVSESNASALKE